MDMEKKSPLRDVMNSPMEKVREMVDANNIVGAPITTPDGVTLIPISRVSFGFGSGFSAHFLGGFHRSLALHLVGALFVVFRLTRSERFLLLDFLLVLFVDLLHRVFDGVIGQRIIDFGLHDLVHFILGAAELRNRLANGFRDGGQFVGTENQKAEQENEEELSSTDTKHGTTFPFVHTTVPYYHTHGRG